MTKKQLPITVDEEVFSYIRSKVSNVSEYINALLKAEMEGNDDIFAINKKINRFSSVILDVEKQIDVLNEKKLLILRAEEEEIKQVREAEEAKLSKEKELKDTKITKIRQILEKNKPLLKELVNEFKKNRLLISDLSFLFRYVRKYSNVGIDIIGSDIKAYIKSL